MRPRFAFAALLAVLFAMLEVPALADRAGCDPEPGRRAFVKCLVCHTAKSGAGHLEGPNLWGVVGRPVGGATDFSYSPPFAEAQFLWTRESLELYLEDPDGFLPGTRMMTAGISDADERRDLSCYMATLQGIERE